MDNEIDTVDPQVEVRARNMGWVPEAEWDEEKAAKEGRRKPGRFKAAEEYIKDIESNIPALIGRNRHLSDKVTGLEQQVARIPDLEAKLDDTGRLAEHLLESQKRSADAAYQRCIEATEKRMKQAVKESDDEAYDAAKADRDRLEEERTETEPEPPPRREPEVKEPERNDDTPEARRRAAREKLDPETRSWVESNPWFDTDIVLNGAMIEELGEVKTERPGLSVSDGLAEAKRRVMDKFPRKFGLNPARDAPPTVGRPGPGGQHTNGHAFADIPREDQESFRRQQRIMKERGTEWTDEEIAASYWEFNK